MENDKERKSIKIDNNDIIVLPTVQENRNLYPFFGFFNKNQFKNNNKQDREKSIDNANTNNTSVKKDNEKKENANENINISVVDNKKTKDVLNDSSILYYEIGKK